MSYQIPWETCRIGWVWSKYTTEIDEYRHFRSNSGKTYPKIFLLHQTTRLEILGGVHESTSQNMDEIDLFW